MIRITFILLSIKNQILCLAVKDLSERIQLQCDCLIGSPLCQIFINMAVGKICVFDIFITRFCSPGSNCVLWSTIEHESCYINTSLINKTFIFSLTIHPSQPCPKRARQENSAEQEYSRYIQTAESALKALQALTDGKTNSSAPPPQWLDSRLQELQTLLTHITTVRPSSSR